MKYCITFLILIGFLISCNKESNTCQYAKNTFIDTTLFVTFKISDKKLKFYQIKPLELSGWNSGSNLIVKDVNTSICRYDYQINFVSFTEANIPEFFAYPEFMLEFSKSFVWNKIEGRETPKLIEVFSNVTSFSSSPFFEDTLFMNGMSISLKKLDSTINFDNPPSTSNVFKYYI